jgi:hypothetical protein
MLALSLRMSRVLWFALSVVQIDAVFAAAVDA